VVIQNPQCRIKMEHLLLLIKNALESAAVLKTFWATPKDLFTCGLPIGLVNLLEPHLSEYPVLEGHN